MKNLLVVDGNSILNRAYYGIRPLTTKEGIPTNAVYGFITIIKKHIDALKPDFMVCAFDLHAPTFRHKEYDLYKANRKGMPDDLAAQLPWAKQVAKALGFKVIECEGFEADDIIGTVCSMGDEDGDVHSYALTGDRDSLQLITENTSVILVKTKEDIVYTPEKFKEDYHVTPLEYIDVKALMGDSSDNIPGVKGIGEKTAFKLVEELGSLEKIYEDTEALPVGKSAKEKIALGKEDAFTSRFLATIVKNAPIGYSLEELATDGYNAEELSRLFLKLEFSALYKRFDFSEAAPAVPEETAVEFNVPEFEEVGFSELSALSGETVSVSFDGGKIYAAFGGRYVSAVADEGLSELLSKNDIVCHDLKTLSKKTDIYNINCAFDTMLAGYLLSPGTGSYPLDKLVFSYLKYAAEGEAFTGALEAYAVSVLYPMLLESLKKENMEKLLHDVEIPLAKVLAGMEKCGMKLDGEGLREYSAELCKLRDTLVSLIYSAAGHEFNINSPKQLGAVLFEELKLPVIKKTKSGYSTNVDVLNALKPYHEIIGDILSYREVSKLISTYAEVLPDLADEKGRIHTSFNQTGTATGRLSSSDPNLQNIPVRGQLGREIRKYFVAEEGHVLIDADYSQIELRVLAEISGDENMMDAFLSGKDIHTATAAQVFDVSELMVDAELRRRAKAVNFGIVYGIGAFSLSQDLGITRKQADEYIKNYLRTYPNVDSYLKNTVASAKENGYTVTLFGRKRLIPELSASNKNLQAFGERVAMNSPIQGTAADIIKIAMINAAKALEESGLDARLVMQVHDELIVEARKEDAAAASEILKREMENTVKTTVPMLVEISTASNWYEAK
ncbi:MAG: DNA polymerase I [Ruminococcaceae bacterium]|nr:DNA polymerase I [Oscillospiraceae bacterium]